MVQSWRPSRKACWPSRGMANERKTGARGLRTIVENMMMEIMYEIPTRGDVRKVVVTRETVENNQIPTLVLSDTPKETKGQERGIRILTLTAKCLLSL